MEAVVTTSDLIRPASLLGLPAELRLQIYDLIYEPCFQPQQQFNPFYCTADLKYCPKRGRSTLLHQVNRQLRHECLPIYLQRNTFVFDLSVLDPDTAEPTLVSWAKSSGEDAILECNIIVNMRAVPKERPMFTIFVSSTKSGQRLSFKENDFSIDCNILARGMREAKTLCEQNLACRHKRCARYVDTINELKQILQWLTLEIPSLRPGLSVADIVEIAKASKLLKQLDIPARWSRAVDASASNQENLVSRYSKLIASAKDTVQARGHDLQHRKLLRRSRKG
jgi:hypothetical protein